MAVDPMERRVRGWRLAWLLTTLVALGLLAALLFRGGGWSAPAIGNEQAASVSFDGDRWRPAGEPVPYPMSEMALVGEAAGLALYTHRVQAIAAGGGGGLAEPRPARVTRLYMRTEAGEFQPLEREE